MSEIDRGRGGCLYRAFDAYDCLLYVGCTLDLRPRLRHHARNAIWRGGLARWHVRRHTDWHTAAEREREVIATEFPRWNLLWRSADHPDGPATHWTEIAELYPEDVLRPLGPSDALFFDHDLAAHSAPGHPPSP